MFYILNYSFGMFCLHLNMFHLHINLNNLHLKILLIHYMLYSLLHYMWHIWLGIKHINYFISIFHLDIYQHIINYLILQDNHNFNMKNCLYIQYIQQGNHSIYYFINTFSLGNLMKHMILCLRQKVFYKISIIHLSMLHNLLGKHLNMYYQLNYSFSMLHIIMILNSNVFLHYIHNEFLLLHQEY